MSLTISKSDVKKHNRNNDLWLIIHNDVYDVTKFLSEHPGGEDTLLDNAGKNATEPFDDVGHSDDAKELLKKYKIGTLPLEERDTGNAEGCCPRAPKSDLRGEKHRKSDSHSRCSKKHSRSSGLEPRGSWGKPRPGEYSETAHTDETSHHVNTIYVPLDPSCPGVPKPEVGEARPRKCEALSSCPRFPQPEVCRERPWKCEALSRCSKTNPCSTRLESRVSSRNSCLRLEYSEPQEPSQYDSIYVPLGPRNDALCSQCSSIESCPRAPKTEVCEETPRKSETRSRCSKKHCRSSGHGSRGSSRHSSRGSEFSESALTDVTSNHCNTIYVPLEPRGKRPRGEPCGSNLKWILLAMLLSAVVVGVLIKRKA